MNSPADEPTGSTAKNLQPSAWWRVCLLLLLIPMAVVAVALAQLPIPALLGYQAFSDDGRFVLTGYLDDDGMDYRLLSLHTGKTYRFHGVSAGFSHENLYWYEPKGDRILGKRFDLESLEVVDLGSFDARLVWAKNGQKYTRSSASITHPGIMAALSGTGELWIVDFPTGATASLTLPVVAGAGAWYPEWCGSSQRLLVVELSTGATKGKDRILLFSYANGKIEKVAEWTATQFPIVVHDRLLSLTSDLQLEIRQLFDGTLIQTQPLAGALNLAVPITTRPLSVYLGGNVAKDQTVSDVETGLIEIVARPTRHMWYDYLQQHVQWEQAFSRMRCTDRRFEKVSYVTERAVEVWNFHGAAPLLRLDFGSEVFNARLVAGGEQLWVLHADESVQLYDLATGKLRQTVRSRIWVIPTFVALIAAFAAWCCRWIKLSLQRGVGPQWDVVILNAVLLAGLLPRVFLVASLRDPNRFIYQVLEALGISWLLMLSLWFIFGNARWSRKIIAPLLGLAGKMVLAMVVFRGDRQSIWELLVAALGITVTVSAMFGIVRKLGWRLIDQSDQHPQHEQHAENRVPLRDTFLVLAASGVFFAVVRIIPAGHFDRQLAGRLAIYLMVIALSALGAIWSALSRRHWLLRVLVLVLFLVMAGSLYTLFFPRLHNLSAWCEHLRFAGMVSGFTCASLLIFRVRGWRLGRRWKQWD